MRAQKEKKRNCRTYRQLFTLWLLVQWEHQLFTLWFLVQWKRLLDLLGQSGSPDYTAFWVLGVPKSLVTHWA